VDLTLEAAHLQRFRYNFRKSKDVSFPAPIYPLVHPSVLVEVSHHFNSQFLICPSLTFCILNSKILSVCDCLDFYFTLWYVLHRCCNWFYCKVKYSLLRSQLGIGFLSDVWRGTFSIQVCEFRASNENSLTPCIYWQQLSLTDDAGKYWHACLFSFWHVVNLCYSGTFSTIIYLNFDA
jgi:hypothetical protein